jgi:uncharacterized protein YoaH (UPF0181 family)
MPFGIAKSKGGDSKRNVAKVEKRVKALMAKGYSKVSAIKIAKSRM